MRNREIRYYLDMKDLRQKRIMEMGGVNTDAPVIIATKSDSELLKDLTDDVEFGDFVVEETGNGLYLSTLLRGVMYEKK